MNNLDLAVRLKDGILVTIRPIRSDDAARLRHFHQHLSRATIRFRFFTFHPELSPEEAEHLTQVDYDCRMAFVATVPDAGDEHIVGVARYDATSPGKPYDAEFAIVLRDDYQGRGLGRQLLIRLADYARAHDLRSMSGTLLSDNVHMLQFLRSSGYPLQLQYKGSDELDFSIDLTAGRSPAIA